jgi:hypothetical protein
MNPHATSRPDWLRRCTSAQVTGLPRTTSQPCASMRVAAQIMGAAAVAFSVVQLSPGGAKT